ncbi:MAG: hypothetical protein EOP22_06260 [Hyphomicrobiales bacterium]|nr:MAG: hypothetical protein EOP22_06260 [Hyphomicrobiales bacterium]
MRHAIAIGAAAMLALAVPALGQEAGANPSLSLSGETSAVGTANQGPLDAQITGDNSYGALLAAINAGDAVDLSAVSDANQVSVVLVSTLEGDAAELDAALAGHSDALTTLRGNVTANAAISAKLTADGHSVDDVIALRTDANGHVLVFVDDRAK